MSLCADFWTIWAMVSRQVRPGGGVAWGGSGSKRFALLPPLHPDAGESSWGAVVWLVILSFGQGSVSPLLLASSAFGSSSTPLLPPSGRRHHLLPQVPLPPPGAANVGMTNFNQAGRSPSATDGWGLWFPLMILSHTWNLLCFLSFFWTKVKILLFLLFF